MPFWWRADEQSNEELNKIQFIWFSHFEKIYFSSYSFETSVFFVDNAEADDDDDDDGTIKSNCNDLLLFSWFVKRYNYSIIKTDISSVWSNQSFIRRERKKRI